MSGGIFDGLRSAQDRAGGTAGLGHRLSDLLEDRACRLGALRGARDTVRNLAGGGTLLSDRRCNRRRVLVDFLHPAGNAPNGIDGASGGILDGPDLRRDLLGGLGGLHRQRLDLGRDDGKAAARLPGSGCFNGRVEREQIGLLGDIWISLTTSPIFCAASASSTISWLVAPPRSRRRPRRVAAWAAADRSPRSISPFPRWRWRRSPRCRRRCWTCQRRRDCAAASIDGRR